jgi:hypothetical protein
MRRRAHSWGVAIVSPEAGLGLGATPPRHADCRLADAMASGEEMAHVAAAVPKTGSVLVNL